MAVLDARAADEEFDAGDASTVSFQGGLVFDPGRFVWSTQGGHRIEATGFGFTYFNGMPTGGTVTQVRIDLGTDGDFTTDSDIDVVITDLAAALQNLVSASTVEESAEGFWQELMAGNDTSAAAELDDARLFGDFFRVQGKVFNPVSLTGGNDRINSNGKVEMPLSFFATPNVLVGDAMSVDGAAAGMIAYMGELTGGNDTITAGGLALYHLIGDANGVGELGHVAGGDDRLTSNQTGTPFQPLRSPIQLAGDVQRSFGSVVGGNDTIIGTNFPFLEEVLAGDVVLQDGGTTTGGNDRLLGRAGLDLLTGDVFRLTDGTLNGGNDTVFGGDDSDLIAGDLYTMEGGTLNAGNDRLYGDAGNDSIVGDVATFSGAITIVAGNDYLSGGDGDDTLIGDLGSGTAFLPANIGGNDTLDGGWGNDSLIGGGGIDTATFASIAQAVVVDLSAGTASGQGKDTLIGIENVIGSSGNDRLTGSTIANRLDGRDGNDTLRGGDGADTLLGGNDDDRLISDADDDLLIGADGDDSLLGGDGADVLNGGTGNDTLLGGPGDDTLRGAAGNDSLAGGGGNDLLVGGAEGDVLAGGAGADTFDFNAVSESTPGAGRDTISDFSSAQGDKIDLATIDADTGTAGNQAFTFIGAAAFSGTAGELRFTKPGGNGLLTGDVDGDGMADLAILLTGFVTLTVADVVL